jgi:hypothetical protein
LLEFFNKKYASYNYNTMHILKSLVYFTDADADAEPAYLLPTDWQTVKKEIQKETDKYLKLKS